MRIFVRILVRVFVRNTVATLGGQMPGTCVLFLEVFSEPNPCIRRANQVVCRKQHLHHHLVRYFGLLEVYVETWQLLGRRKKARASASKARELPVSRGGDSNLSFTASLDGTNFRPILESAARSYPRLTTRCLGIVAFSQPFVILVFTSALLWFCTRCLSAPS